jgi:lipopolysaccharide transport system permease protein
MRCVVQGQAVGLAQLGARVFEEQGDEMSIANGTLERGAGGGNKQGNAGAAVLAEFPQAAEAAAAIEAAAYGENARVHPSPAVKVLKIRPRRPWSWAGVVEFWSYRDLLWTLALRDLRLRYRQTALGVLWVVFQPVAGAGVFSVVFGWIAGLGSRDGSYFLFTLSGMLIWNVFQSTLAKASMALVGNAPLVSKVYFPRLLLPFSTILSTIVDFGIGFLVFVCVAAFNGWTASAAGLLVFGGWLLVGLIGACGLGLLASALMTRFRDVQHVLPLLLPFVMYATPVAYSLQRVPEKWMPVYSFNPMTWVLEGGRFALFGEGTPVSTGWVLYTLVASFLAFGIGLFGFRRMERSFADVL